MDYVIAFFTCLTKILNCINPFAFAFCTILWVVLHNRTKREVSRMDMRSYVIERQIEHIVNTNNLEHVDIEYLKLLQSIYNEYKP